MTGRRPVLDTPFPPWPSFSDEEIEAVARVLRSGRVNAWTGSECRSFETEFAAWAGTEHAVAVANGTVALDMAWRALGIGIGDEVITTPRSFVASASTIAMAGARPVFADVDPDTQNITPETVAPLITPRTRAILCVHLAGWPCDMVGFRALADRHGLKLVEDCAQAHGGAIDGKSVGSFGDIAAWSFCQDKIITTGGEGGMITMNDHALKKAVWSQKDHGKGWDAVHRTDHGPGFRWLHQNWGTNGRLTEMQAAIGRIQLTRMHDWHAARRRNAEALATALQASPGLRIPMPPTHVEHAWYKFHMFVQPEWLKPDWNRDRIMSEINAGKIPCQSGGCPEIYREKVFLNSSYVPERPLPVASLLGTTSLMLLVHPTLEPVHMAQTAAVVNDVMQEATHR